MPSVFKMPLLHVFGPYGTPTRPSSGDNLREKFGRDLERALIGLKKRHPGHTIAHQVDAVGFKDRKFFCSDFMMRLLKAEAETQVAFFSAAWEQLKLHPRDTIELLVEWGPETTKSLHIYYASPDIVFDWAPQP